MPDQLPTECPTQAITFHPERRRNTAMGMEELAGWWRQLQALKNPIRVEFHLMCLLSGSRPGALKAARWCDVDVRRRVLHIPCPKGGEERAFDIPLSREMLRSLWRVRKAGRQCYAERVQEWIFPASSRSGHLAEHKEHREILGNWGGDLRQTYRTVAQSIGISDLDIHLLMNHSLPGASAGYVTRSQLVSTSLRDAQERLSTSIIMRMISSRTCATLGRAAGVPKDGVGQLLNQEGDDITDHDIGCSPMGWLHAAERETIPAHLTKALGSLPADNVRIPVVEQSRAVPLETALEYAVSALSNIRRSEAIRQ
jgi:hypothetical protein